MTKKLIPLVVVIFMGLCLLSACGRHPGTTGEVTEVSTSSSISESTPTETSGKKPTPTPTPIVHEYELNLPYAVEPLFDDALPFNAFGYAVVGIEKEGKMLYGIIDESGKYLLEPQFEDYCIPTGEKITHPEMDIGYTWLQKDGLWGFVNDKCEWVIQCQYDGCKCFTDLGLAGVLVDGKWGFVSTSGKMIVEPIYDDVDIYFGDEYAKICLDDKWGLIDRTGHVICAPKFSYIRTDGDLSEWGFWNDGGADVFMYGNYEQYGLASITGEILTEPLYWNWFSFSSDGYAYVESEDYTGLINTSGEQVVRSNFAYDGLVVVEQIDDEGNTSCWYTDGAGKEVFDKKFEYACYFSSDGLALVQNNGKYGYIDETGDYVIEPQYDGAISFDSNGCAAVQENGKWAIIDKSGELKTEFIFDSVKHIWSSQGKGYPIMEICIGEKIGYADCEGNIMIEPQYDWIAYSNPYSDSGGGLDNFSDADLIMTTIKSTNTNQYSSGIVSLQGEILLNPVAEQDNLTVSENGYVSICIDGKYGYVDVVD